MKMKSLIRLNPKTYDDTMSEFLIDFISRLDVVSDVLDDLRDRGEMSGTELDKLVAQKYGMKGFSVRPFLDSFKNKGIRTEVRKEECIKVKMKHYEWGRLYKTHEDDMFIFVPIHRNPPYIIFHPTIESTDRDMVYLCGERIVQVERKYYILEE